ncbi:MAG: hypothetical protein HUJ56_02775 [Erysipelotrichaceae bacterium]|nr:hypothetical protein [Erysipelotrichaceae bacterium]
MFSKLKDLLFEESEEYDDEEDDDEYGYEEPVIVEKRKKPVRVEADPVRIAPVQSRPQPVAPVVEEKKKLGINIDELQDIAMAPVEKEVKPEPVEVKQPVKKPEVAPRPVAPVKEKPSYEFTPVISPIFGTNDADAAPISIKTTKSPTGNDSKIGTIISPMYGVNRDQDVDRVTKKAPAKKPVVVTQEEKVAEENVPVMTLDEILAAHRRGEPRPMPEPTRTFKGEEFDRTVIVNNHNISLFDDEDEEEEE